MQVIHSTFGDIEHLSPSTEGLLVIQPSSGASKVGRAAWVVLESGDILLRRSASEIEAVAAAVAHLQMVQVAASTELLPLRLRPVICPDGSAILVSPAAAHKLAGFDRRLRSKGYVVLPTTIAVVDPESCEIVVPETVLGDLVPVGRHQISSLWLTWAFGEDHLGADVMLALARSYLRRTDTHLSVALDQIALLVDAFSRDVRIAEVESLRSIVKELGS